MGLDSGDEWKAYGNNLLSRFNRFLQHIYGSEIRFSTILSKKGASREQISHWKRDRLWIIRFLERFERKLVGVLEVELPGLNPRILINQYLKGWSVEQAAREHDLALTDAEQITTRLLDYLKSEPGKETLEESVLLSARKTR